MHVLVIGGGLAGLAAGIELRKQGIRVDLMENDLDADTEGTVASLGGAGLRAFRRLGLLDAVLRHGASWDGVDVYTRTGAKLATPLPLRPIQPDVPGNGAIRYPVLMRILSGAARGAGVDIRSGCAPAAMAQDRDGISVDFGNGRGGRYDLVIGADGPHSPTRKALLPGPAALQGSKQGNWQLLMPRTPGLERSMIWLGRGVKVALNPVAQDAMCLSVTAGEEADPSRYPARLNELLSDLPPALESCLRSPLRDAAPVSYRPVSSVLVASPWYRQRAVFVGDTVHASTPHVVSGACTGVEDAIVLGEELARAGSITQALDRYFTRRWSRCRTVVRNSRRLLEIELAGGPKKEHDRLLHEMLQVLDKPI